MTLDFDTLQKIIGPVSAGSKQAANAISMLTGLEVGGHRAGLDRPHRLAAYLGQIMHESCTFRYDREIWGNTKAQIRYDTRTDLGNTPERDGDGFKYRGRTPIQITGKRNYELFRYWCGQIDPAAPDFVANPDAANTDPWEGLGPIWYWSATNLNKYADDGDLKLLTKRINGGYNGLDDRLRWTDRSGLVLLGYSRNGVTPFQRDTGIDADGRIGPQTRWTLHETLKALPAINLRQNRKTTC